MYGVGYRVTVQSKTDFDTDDEIAEAARTAKEESESRNKPRSIDQLEELRKTAYTTVKIPSVSLLVQSHMYEPLRARRRGGDSGGRRRHGRRGARNRNSACVEETGRNTHCGLSSANSGIRGVWWRRWGRSKTDVRSSGERIKCPGNAIQPCGNSNVAAVMQQRVSILMSALNWAWPARAVLGAASACPARPSSSSFGPSIVHAIMLLAIMLLRNLARRRQFAFAFLFSFADGMSISRVFWSFYFLASSFGDRY